MNARAISPTNLIRIGLVLIVVLTIALLFGVSVSRAGIEACPPGTILVIVDKEPVCVPVGGDEPNEDEPTFCDFGRHPEKLWSDNPSGHPFERHFCECPGPDVACHPLDTAENDGLYCDEVPGCWAFLITPRDIPFLPVFLVLWPRTFRPLEWRIPL